MDFYQFDEAYLLGLRRGDPGIAEHFASYFGQLIRIKLGRRVTHRDTIDDIRQETFKRVFAIVRSARGVRQAEALGALVNSVCNRVYLESLRKGHREKGGVEDSDHASSTGDSLDTLIAEERALAVRDVLDELPEGDRRLLTAIFLEEVDRDALCVDLGVSRDYLRVLLHRAVNNFRNRCAKKEATLFGSHNRMGAAGA